jgi:hypothetical protein
MSIDLTQAAPETPATRADLARRLSAQAELMGTMLGTIPLAAEVQVLKRDLSRGHATLRAAGERGFLSAVTLVESALACLTWKQYTAGIVDALREAFAAGARPGPFVFADYDAIRRMFAACGIATTPAIDLDTLPAEDLDDGEGG